MRQTNSEFFSDIKLLYYITGFMIYLSQYGFNKGFFSTLLELVLYGFFWFPMLVTEIVLKYGYLQ